MLLSSDVRHMMPVFIAGSWCCTNRHAHAPVCARLWAGIIDAVGVVSGTGGGAGNLGSAGSNAGVGGGSVTGPGRAQLTREEENAALVVGGLKALDTVIWQMLASVMIPGGCGVPWCGFSAPWCGLRQCFDQGFKVCCHLATQAASAGILCRHSTADAATLR